MPIGYVDLTMDQGSNFSFDILCVDDFTGANANMMGFLVRSQMRKTYNNSNVTISFTTTPQDLPNGIFTVAATANQTMNVYSGLYIMDVELYDNTGNVYRILEGTVTVTPEVTR